MGNKQDITKPGVRWCLTDGWGDCESRVEPWHRAKSFHTACRAIGKIASGRYPEFRKVWTFSYTERGVVCDFGSYRFFGFIENAKFPEVEVSPECSGSSSDVSLPHGGKPDKEVSAPEYLECEDGKRLADLFSRYFSEALGRGGSWWMSHALSTAVCRSGGACSLKTSRVSLRYGTTTCPPATSSSMSGIGLKTEGTRRRFLQSHGLTPGLTSSTGRSHTGRSDGQRYRVRGPWSEGVLQLRLRDTCDYRPIVVYNPPSWRILMEEGLSWPDAVGLAFALLVAALVIWRN